MAALKNMYHMKYHKTLESDVKGDVSGYLEKLFVVSMQVSRYRSSHSSRCVQERRTARENLVSPPIHSFACFFSHYNSSSPLFPQKSLQGTRDEIGHYQYNIDADVHSLYKAGEGRMGTDESQFIHILCNRPDAHLRSVFQAYQQRYHKKFTKVIKSEFSGWIKTAMCYLVSWIQNPAHCVAKNLENAMKGMGTDDQALIRQLVRNRTPVFMNQIKGAYMAKYKRSLRERIKGETSGDYRRTLLAVIGEPEQ